MKSPRSAVYIGRPTFAAARAQRGGSGLEGREGGRARRGEKKARGGRLGFLGPRTSCGAAGG
eukprot:10359272-Alexandrium_andersonii.AAC.1